jgi:integrase
MKRRRVLTDRQVASLPRKATRYAIADPELRSFYLRVPPQGPVSYVCIVKKKGKQTWEVVGNSADLKIADARERAHATIKRIKSGTPAPKPPQSVSAVCASWLERHVVKNRLRTEAELRRIIGVYIEPHIGNENFTSLKRSDFVTFLDLIEDRHSAAVADATLTVLRSIANWVQKRSDDYTPPFARGMKRVPKSRHDRSRILTDGELRTLWHASAGAGPLSVLIKLLLLTCQRLAKVRDMRWVDISPDGIWSIPQEPGEKTNGGRLRLPQAALDLVYAQPPFAGSPFVFTQKPTNKHKLAFEARCGVSGWRLHDLRRTSRSLMSRLGVPFEVAEAILGHSLRGVAGIYDRHSYEIEKGNALAELAAAIQQIVDPADNVILLTAVP